MSIYRKYPKGYYVYYYLRNKDSQSVPDGKTGTPYYIGKGKTNRAWRGHTKTIRIPNDDSFIVIINENLTEEQAFKIETVHIKMWGRIDLNTGILRNKTDGGDGASGTVRSPETREKIRQTLKSRPGRKHSEQTKKLISQRNKSRILTPESKQRMMEGLAKGRGPRSDATKAKLSVTKKGMVFSESHKESLKKAWTNRSKTPHNKGKSSPKICCVGCQKILSHNGLTAHTKYYCSAIKR